MNEADRDPAAPRVKLSRPLMVIMAFVVLTVLGGVTMAVINWNYEFIYYGLVMLVLVAAVGVLHFRVNFPMFVLWGLALWVLVHMGGGTIPIPGSVAEPGTPHVLYNLRLLPWLPKYDQVVHCYGFFVSTLACWRALVVMTRGAGGTPRPTIGALSAAALMGNGLGALNEVIEFVATRIMPGTNVGGYVNTGWDLVSNLTGTILAALLIRALPRRFDDPALNAPARAS
ncbi:MAG: hypothetical protein U0638_09110 [Phycisphaerales bacterium]